MYTKEVVKKVFRELDLNGDGKITADEFSKKEVDAAIAAGPYPQEFFLSTYSLCRLCLAQGTWQARDGQVL